MTRVLVFGGSGAVGGEVVRHLAREGAQVAFTYLTGEDRARALAEENPGTIMLPLDLSSVTDIGTTVRSAHEQLGGIDAWVQCAAVGVGNGKPDERGVLCHPEVPEIDEATWDRIHTVNTKATFFAIQHLLPLMRERGGNLVVVGSLDGIKPVPSPVHYAASKGALSAMVQSLAKEIGPSIRVNLVAPAILEGGMSRELPQVTKDEYLKHSGLRRFGTLAEVAATVTWFALHNTYVTGRSLALDGAL